MLSAGCPKVQSSKKGIKWASSRPFFHLFSLPSSLSSCLWTFRPSSFRLSWCPSRPLLLLSWSYLALCPAVLVDPERRLRRKHTRTPPGSDHSVAFSCFLLCNRSEMLRLPEDFSASGE